MLLNLKAEMTRFGISDADIAKAIGRSERSVRDKISGRSQFTFPEANTLRNQLFPGLKLEYLFSRSGDKDAS